MELIKGVMCGTSFSNALRTELGGTECILRSSGLRVSSDGRDANNKKPAG